MVRLCWGVLAATLPVLISAPSAAIDERVRNACRGDYHKFCSSYAVGSEELRTCMRKADKDLSPGCIDALVAAGEVSAKEVARSPRRRASAR